MTDLTEQWKKGEFIICNAGKCQYYYVQNEEQKEVIKTEYCLFDDNTPNWQILAPVPSYDEWQAKLEQNAQLKKLLKECKKMLMQSNYQNMTQYHEVLDIRDKINKIIGEK